MKKIIAISLTLLMVLFCFVGCSSKDEEQSNNNVTEKSKEIYAVGDTVDGSYFRFTLKEANFSKSINTNKDDDFLKPVSAYKNTDKYGAPEDNQWLSYTVEYEYIGKKDLHDITSLFMPKVLYQDYEFNANYFTFFREIDSVNWYIYSTDNETINHTLLKNMSYSADFNYKPLSSQKYEIRGIIAVPEQAVLDTESPITLKILDCTEANAEETLLSGVPFNIERDVEADAQSEFEMEAKTEILENLNTKFVENYLDKFSTINGEEISKIIEGKWKSSRGNYQIFEKDGQYIAGDPDDSTIADFKSTWKVEDDCINIGGDLWKVYKLYDNAYYLSLTDSLPSGIIIVK